MPTDKEILKEANEINAEYQESAKAENIRPGKLTNEKSSRATDGDNMWLWNQVCFTDPDTTKKVQVSKKSRKFTSIDAQIQFKRATELWGPYGGLWGLVTCVFSEIKDGNGNTVELALDAMFYYPGEHAANNFSISTDIGFRPNGDSRKKLMTDATTKALSKLGFNSDVFEGLFDDNKYVAEMRRKFAKKKAEDIMNQKKADAIMANGKRREISTKETTDFVRWYAINKSLNPKGKVIGKALSNAKIFNEELDKWIANNQTISTDTAIDQGVEPRET